MLAVKEFEEPSTKLGFNGFDDVATDGGHPENQPPPEEVDERKRGRGRRRWGMETNPPAVDEYH